MTEKIEVMVDGGKATAAPPLGPALGPLKINIQAVVDEINAKTRALAGMKVPVKVIVNEKTKEFEIQVGTPPTSAIIKKELNIQKGSSESGKIRAGDLSMDQVKNIAMSKFGSDDERFVNQVIGTARSMGITVDHGGLSEDEEKAAEKSHKDAKAGAAPAPAAEGEAAEGGAEEPEKEEKE
ncbi:MAG: 50S ribosomal protein L11 [Candidatus Aenigmarchaeota archaeon]|nr:50S ribosomal protein L11 [Candidatus Aenigmarchaeota archaeon]